MGQMQRIGKHATSVFTDGGVTHVMYHRTAVVVFNDAAIILRSGGRKTATTKARMNQASNQFSLGFHVYQRDSIWYVDYRGKTIEFEDEMVLNRP